MPTPTTAVPVELQRNFRVHYVRCPEDPAHFILADANAPDRKRPATHLMMTECRGCGEHHRVTTTESWKTGYVSKQELDELRAYREPQPEADDPDAVSGLVALEERPYKDFVIEVEIYRRSDGSGYYPWPYVIKYREDVRYRAKSAEHFYVSMDRFPTKDEALNFAIQEARKRIDDGFDPSQR
ncbi:MAG TPA: hypothetical protein VKW06_17755 [Candidatus Angelobacter sp.]|nr:hypothetical protein [Candidatus Angelobacter sp.]